MVTTMLSQAATRNPLKILVRVRCVSVYSHPRPQPSAAYFDPSKAADPSVAQTPENLTEAQCEELRSALRVDQAGEVAANYIYKGQLAVLSRDPKYGPLIQVSSTIPNQYVDRFNGSRKCGTKRKSTSTL